jgi:ABC-2 type transport system permease protein
LAALLRQSSAALGPRLIGQQRVKSWLFFETFLPFIATAGYVFVYRAMQAPEDYIGFVVMGGAMTSFWMNVMWSMSAQLYWEKDNGNLALYIIAPNSLMAVLLGMALGGMLSTTLRAGVILILGTWLFQVPFAVSSFAQLFAVFLLSMTACRKNAVRVFVSAMGTQRVVWRCCRSRYFLSVSRASICRGITRPPYR